MESFWKASPNLKVLDHVLRKAPNLNKLWQLQHYTNDLFACLGNQQSMKSAPKTNVKSTYYDEVNNLHCNKK